MTIVVMMVYNFESGSHEKYIIWNDFGERSFILKS